MNDCRKVSQGGREPVKNKQTENIRPGYLRRAGAAKYLGISIRTLGNLQASRMVPFSKLGEKTCLFRISDLDAMVARFRQDCINGAA
jgi:hypothetical protein